MSTAPGWTFLTNHAHVLICIARNPEQSMRAISERVGITERAVQRIVTDLEDAGYLTRARIGRRNTYRLDPRGRLRHPVEGDTPLIDLLAVLAPGAVAPVSRAVVSGGAGRRPGS